MLKKSLKHKIFYITKKIKYKIKIYKNNLKFKKIFINGKFGKLKILLINFIKIKKKKNYFFFFNTFNKNNFFFFYSFLKLLKNLIIGIQIGYSKIIYLFGRGFFLNKNFFILITKLGFSHKKYLLIPKNIFFKKLTKQKYYIYGINFFEFQFFLKKLKNLKKL
jgi:ribosomal protein L6P/L9E